MLIHNTDQTSKPTRVVVIGAGGFVGGAVADLLDRHDVPVLRVGRAQVDLLAPDAADRLAALLRPGDSVVAASAIAPCKNRTMLQDNVVLANAILEALDRVAPAHVVNISSDAVYGDLPVPLSETSAAAPGSLHGVMHLARELMFASTLTAQPVAMLRPTLIYGAKDPHNGYGPNQFRRKARAGEDIVLFGEGEERRDHVFVGDVAELAVRTLFRRSSGILNLATGSVHSFREIAELVLAQTGASIAIKGSPRKGPMPHNGYRPFDPAATFAAFPDFRYRSFPEGLVETLAQDMT